MEREKENRKNLDVLSKLVDLKVISPSSSNGMIFNYKVKDKRIIGNKWEVLLFNKIKFPLLSPAIYFINSIDLGLREFKPNVIHIESDPFTPIFIQTLLSAKLFARNAKIVCTIKQNTFTKRNIFVDSLKRKLTIFFSKYIIICLINSSNTG